MVDVLDYLARHLSFRVYEVLPRLDCIIAGPDIRKILPAKTFCSSHVRPLKLELYYHKLSP
jgi:hypothetical protein